MLELHEFSASGNCHKIRLMLSLLGLSYRSHAVNGTEREQKSAPFLAMNPFGQVPVLTDGNITIRDSQAILVYLAAKYGENWLPEQPEAIAQVIGWLSTAANEVARGPALLRLHRKFGRNIDVAGAEELSAQLLSILEHHFERHPWLVGGTATIADIAIYPYIALAPEGGISLAAYSNICAWLDRVQQLPGYLDMPGMYRAASTGIADDTSST